MTAKPPAWGTTLPADDTPSPQAMLALKSDAAAPGLTSVKVATVSMNGLPSVAEIVRPAMVSAASPTLTTVTVDPVAPPTSLIETWTG